MNHLKFLCMDDWFLLPHLFNFIFCFDAQLVPALTVALSAGLPSVSFDMPLLCSLFLFNNSLSSVTIRFSKLILYIPCSSPRITYFSEEATFLLLKNGIRNKDLRSDSIIAPGVSLLLQVISVSPTV